MAWRELEAFAGVAFGAIVAFALAASDSPLDASVLSQRTCQPAPLQPTGGDQPFILNDPRSGLSLHLERDRRHMSAVSRGGTIMWQRNLFADTRLERELGPLLLPGDPPSSAKRLLQGRRAEIAMLDITGIAVASDCEAYAIDHHYPPHLRGHYISAGSGTKYMYLLDAKTGDFLVSGIN